MKEFTPEPDTGEQLETSQRSTKEKKFKTTKLKKK